MPVGIRGFMILNHVLGISNGGSFALRYALLLNHLGCWIDDVRITDCENNESTRK